MVWRVKKIGHNDGVVVGAKETFCIVDVGRNTSWILSNLAPARIVRVVTVDTDVLLERPGKLLLECSSSVQVGFEIIEVFRRVEVLSDVEIRGPRKMSSWPIAVD